jgi:hypothetical protein
MFDVSKNGSAEGRAHLQLRRLFTPEPRRFGHRPKVLALGGVTYADHGAKDVQGHAGTDESGSL